MYTVFNYGNFVYLKDNKEEPKIHHKIFILNQEPKFTITPTLIFFKEKLLSLTKSFVRNL